MRLHRILIFLTIFSALLVGCSDKGSTPGKNNQSDGPSGSLYVLNQSDGTIFVYDTKTMTRIDSLEAKISKPHYIAFSPDGESYYVLTVDAVSKVNKFRLSDDAFLGTITLPTNVTPSGMAITLDSKFGYICDYTTGATTGKIYKVDLVTLGVVKQFNGGARAHELKVSGDGKVVVCCNRNSDNLTLIYTDVDSVAQLSIDPDSGYLPSANPKYGPYCIDMDHHSAKAYITCLEASQVRILDLNTRTFIDSINIPRESGPAHLTGPSMTHATHDGNHLWLTTQQGNTVDVVDLHTKQLSAIIPIGVPGPFGIAISNDDSRVYVAATNSNNQNGMLYIIDANSYAKIDSVQVGRSSFGVGWRAK